MPSLERIKSDIEYVISSENMSRVKEDRTRFMIYNGKLREEIKNAIRKEFQKPETINELEKRIIPINVMQKIINKLAGVYKQKPSRVPMDKNPSDQELISLYEPVLRINQKMKFANRYFKKCKHTFLEPFVDFAGVPRMRALSSHMYTPLGNDSNEPERMTAWVKHVSLHPTDSSKTRLHYWDNERFLIFDGKSKIVQDELNELQNPSGINPYGVIPGTYISESDDGNLIPIPDDDLLSMSIVIPILLTDTAFASKYLLWSMLAFIGADAQNLTFNPTTIFSLPAGADVKVIKPELDMEKALGLVRELVGLLLTSKNLSVGDLSQITVKTAASGVAKLLDSAETTEDRGDQQEFFSNGEKDFWGKYSHNILPVWVKGSKLDRKYVGSFTDDFELSIKYPDPKPFIGDKDRVELETKKLKAGLTTKDRALQVVNPDLDSDQIEDLKQQIVKDKKQAVQDMQAAIGDEEPDEEDS